jgi:hypothetical protein
MKKTSSRPAANSQPKKNLTKGSAAKQKSQSAAPSKRKAASETDAPTPDAQRTNGAASNGEFVREPGKHHRKPPPSMIGVKHSDQRIAKAKATKEMKIRQRGW